MGSKDIGFSEMREKLANDLLVVFLVLGLPLGLTSTPGLFRDGDTSWHLAVGQWIFRHGRIPATDPFSFAAFGKPWVAMEWPADLLFAGMFRVAGYAGLAAIIAAAVMALNAIIFLYLRRRVGPIGLTITIMAMDLVLSAFILARPHVLVWPVLAAWTVLLARTRETRRPPPWWAALLLVVWTNLHGSFPLAAVIGGCLALDALIAAQWKPWRAWLGFAGLCLVAVCLNLNGLAGLLQPFRIAGLKTLHLIAEWSPSTTGNTPQFFGALTVCLGLMLWRGVRVPVGRLVLLLAMLLLAFTQVRHQSWLVIVAAVLIPPLFGTGPRTAAGKAWPVLAAALPLLLVRAAWPLTPPDSVANPRGLLAHVPATLKGQPVFNEYSFGGPLILAGIRPYIDGRSELYGDAYLTDYVAIAAGDWGRFNRAADRYHIRWTLLRVGNTRLVRELDSSPQWRRVYADRVGVIHVRLSSGAPSVTAAHP